MSAVQAVVGVLKDAGVASGNIYWYDLPPAALSTLPIDCVVVNSVGGSNSSTLPYKVTTVDLLHYSRTRGGAVRIDKKSSKALLAVKSETHNGVWIEWASRAAGPASTIDPDTRYGLCLSSWNVRVAITDDVPLVIAASTYIFDDGNHFVFDDGNRLAWE